jgi:hypothetical protein
MTIISNTQVPRRLKLSTLVPSSRVQADSEDFDRLSYEIFTQLRPSLISNHENWFLLIEPNNKDYFLAPDELVAYQDARKKYPQGQFFFFRLNETGICGKI